LYPIVEKYIIDRCFEVPINDIEDERLRKNINDISIQEAIIDLLAKEIGKITIQSRELTVKFESFKLSKLNHLNGEESI
jgi:type III restriction enzyme